MKLELGQMAIGYNNYGEVVGGKVTAINGDSVTVSGIAGGSLHVEDAFPTGDVPESKTLESRLKPHVLAARRRAEEVEKVAKSKRPAAPVEPSE